MYGCESWTIKKVECQRIDAFELWCWRKFLRVPWIARRSSQSILKEISPEYSLEGLMLKLMLQKFGHLIEELTHWQRPWCWERLKAGEEGMTEAEMVRWHHWLDGHEFGQVLGVGDAIQPSHLLSSPSPPALNRSRHQGLFQWVSSSHPVAKVLKLEWLFL